MREPVALAHAVRLLNHGPTVLVTAAHGGRRNVMAAAWNTPLEFDPPRVLVVIDKTTFTRGLVEASGALGLSVPCRAQADLVYTVGSTSGRELLDGADKFERFGIEALSGHTIAAPGVGGSVAWLEGRVLAEPHLQQAYDGFVVEITAAFADPRAFANGRWRSDADASLATLHHLGGGQFVCAGTPVQARRLDV